MAKPYRVGHTWAIRPCVAGIRRFLGGFRTAAEAREAAARQILAVQKGGQPAFGGAGALTLAQALSKFAEEEIVFHKGAEQEFRRVNRYLRLAGRPTLKLVEHPATGADETKAVGGQVAGQDGKADGNSRRPVYFCETTHATEKRVIPNGLSAHRARQAKRSRKSDRIRQELACTPVARITRQLVAGLIRAMRSDGASASTISLERALLRRLFNYARVTWNWYELEDNPATDLSMPTIDNARDRVMSLAEEERILEALEMSRNPWLAPLVGILVETAMRISEPLLRVTWPDVDLDGRTLLVRFGKTGHRNVPLSRRAVEILEALPRDDEDPRVFQTSYEAIKKAWERMRDRAQVADLRIHDLRHTSVTRFALQCASRDLLKAFSGHKTDRMVERYVHVSAHDVVEHMRKLESAAAEAGSESDGKRSEDAPIAAAAGGTVIYGNFGGRAAK